MTDRRFHLVKQLAAGTAIKLKIIIKGEPPNYILKLEFWKNWKWFILAILVAHIMKPPGWEWAIDYESLYTSILWHLQKKIFFNSIKKIFFLEFMWWWHRWSEPDFSADLRMQWKAWCGYGMKLSHSNQPFTQHMLLSQILHLHKLEQLSIISSK